MCLIWVLTLFFAVEVGLEVWVIQTVCKDSSLGIHSTGRAHTQQIRTAPRRASLIAVNSNRPDVHIAPPLSIACVTQVWRVVSTENTTWSPPVVAPQPSHQPSQKLFFNPWGCPAESSRMPPLFSRMPPIRSHSSTYQQKLKMKGTCLMAFV